MAEVVPHSDEQVLQHFLTHSTWSERDVMDQVARDADRWLGGSEDSALYLDESAFTKKGKKSVGVCRQWNGRLGKIDNSQVGVFGALGRLDKVTLIDARLFLPEEWVCDAARCEQAGIPKQARCPKTKIDLALEIVRHARSLGLRFDWIGMDSLYGNALALLQSLDQQGEIFMADVHRDQHIYLSDPAPNVAAQTAGRGRRRTRFQSDQTPIEVAQWVKRQPEDAWVKKTLRHATKGKLVVEMLHKRVYVWDKKSGQANHWHLIVRRELDSPTTLKYSLSNAEASVSPLRLARMQSQRYWIERAFQDAKSSIGMAHYQARKWSSWHRHMTLVMMAMLFMLEERLQNAESYPLLSCYDIQILLARTLPSRQNNEAQLYRQMEERHRKRQAAMDSAMKQQERKRRSRQRQLA